MNQQRRRRLIMVRRKGIGLVLVMAISMIAGMTDAIGLLMAGDFVSFMSGNTTRAALAIGYGDGATAAILTGAVGFFIIGNALGVVVAGWFRKRLAGLLGVVAVLLCLSAILPIGMRGSPAFFLVVLCMGMINATVEHIEGLPIGLTYVTGGLSRFGRGIGRWLTGDRRNDWIIQIVPWVGMMTGAVIGGLLTLEIGQQALWLVAGSTFVIAIFAFRVPNRLQTHFHASAGSPPRKGK